MYCLHDGVREGYMVVVGLLGIDLSGWREDHLRGSVSRCCGDFDIGRRPCSYCRPPDNSRQVTAGCGTLAFQVVPFM